jgi:hypothetical protein
MPPWESVVPTKHICVKCGGDFEAKRSGAKYCSTACASRARSKRRYNASDAKRRRLARLEKPGYREVVNTVANRRATVIRRWLDEYKIRIGCVDCGYREHAVALDFDHVGPKKHLVSSARSIKGALAEIAQCEVRCSNCHRVRGHERRQQQATSASAPRPRRRASALPRSGRP